MNFTTRIEGGGFLENLWNRMTNSDRFMSTWALFLIVTGFGVPIAGFVGLVALAVTVGALILTGGFGAVSLVGGLFAATVALLAGFIVAVLPLVWDGNPQDPEQKVLNLTELLCLICLALTGFGAYEILGVGGQHALIAATVTPIINLVLFLVDVWLWLHPAD